ncbi:MAG TPA: cation-efflux pump, partial [Erysipelotrichaceae bacterium]|nr:cation-efflux pump [Erysipelotrichaceae bacterium]
MGKLLVRWFIKNPDDVDNEDVRYAYGRLSSFTGIVCNLLLFALKLILGIVSGAISIISDAFNNLSDCLSCLITLFGYKLAAKPADREHPFGHGRMEYIVSFIVAVIIFVVGFELLRSSIESLLHPEAVLFSVYTVVILVVSILVKLWMAGFNRMLGTKLNNIAMIAAAEDSRNDVVTTA